MKNFQFILTLSLGLSLTILSSCKKDEPIPVTPINSSPTAGTVELRVEHIFGVDSILFSLNTPDYFVTALGDSVKFNTFKYYISNIELLKADGSSFKQPESYFLVDASNEISNVLQIPNVQVNHRVLIVQQLLKTTIVSANFLTVLGSRAQQNQLFALTTEIF
jgi:hypothetical protein